MVWRVEFTPIGESDLGKLEKETRRRVIERAEWLGEHFDTIVEFHEGYGWASDDLQDVRRRCAAMNDAELRAEYDAHHRTFLRSADPFAHARDT